MWQYFLSFFFPERCIGCSAIGTALCSACLERIPPALPPQDPALHAVFEYGNPLMQKIIWECKYHRKSRAYELLINTSVPLLSEILSEHCMSEEKTVLVFVPVPQHRERAKKRGYNQSALIARKLADTISGGIYTPLLEKYRDTMPQAKVKHKYAREENVKNSIRTSAPVDSSSIYIVVDDVTTTGATLRESIRALHESGARHVLGIALAHGYSHKTKTTT